MGQSCSYILRPIVTMRYTLISYHFNLLALPFHNRFFMSFWDLSNIQYIFSSSAIATKKNTVSNQIATCRTPKIPKGTSISSFLPVNSCPDVVDPNGASLMLGFSFRRFLTLGGGLNCLDFTNGAISGEYSIFSSLGPFYHTHRIHVRYIMVGIPIFTIQINQM